MRSCQVAGAGGFDLRRRTRGAQRNADSMSAPADNACGLSRPAASADGTPHPVPVVTVASESRVVPARPLCRHALQVSPGHVTARGVLLEFDSIKARPLAS